MNVEMNFTLLDIGLFLCLVLLWAQFVAILGMFLVQCCSQCCFST